MIILEEVSLDHISPCSFASLLTHPLPLSFTPEYPKKYKSFLKRGVVVRIHNSPLFRKIISVHATILKRE